MSLPAFDMRELIEAGVHFGHKTRRWNPRMAPYIYGVRNDIHIINLGKTVPMLQQALQAVRDTVAQNGRILFVGTKRQASDPIAEAAQRCGQYYINQRWLGGLLTNWATIQVSIKTLRRLEDQLDNPNESGFTKKELLSMTRQREKLQASLGGIKDMGG
ncbi:MAG: 30S ribosomal protein S2, partial [Alphaproteobacteria bacterium]